MSENKDPAPAEEKAAEGSVFPGDTPAQSGPSMGEHCVTDRPTASGASPTGEVTKIADVEIYITKPSDYPHEPCKLLLYLSSATGIHSTNNQLQADEYAKEGFLVVMPDQFRGDPFVKSNDVNAVPEKDASLIEQVKLRAAETVQSFMIDMWLARQTPGKVLPLLQKVIEGAKEEFADAVANGGGMYAVGYCFGGKYVLMLAGEDAFGTAVNQPPKDEEQAVTKEGPIIKAGALAHGTMITQKDLESIKSPVSMVCCENDPLFPDEIRVSGQKVLEERQIVHEMKVYPGVPHGFATAGEYSNPEIQSAQKNAYQQMLAWLKSH